MTAGNTPRKNIQSGNQGSYPLTEAKTTGALLNKCDYRPALTGHPWPSRPLDSATAHAQRLRPN